MGLNDPENLETLDKSKMKDDFLYNSILQQKILNFFEKELGKKFDNFFFTKKRKDIIEKVLMQYLEKK